MIQLRVRKNSCCLSRTYSTKSDSIGWSSSSGRCVFHSLWRWREMIVTSVSTCGLQRQSNKDKLSSNEVVKSPRLHIERMNSQTIQMRLTSYHLAWVHQGVQAALLPRMQIFFHHQRCKRSDECKFMYIETMNKKQPRKLPTYSEMRNL